MWNRDVQDIFITCTDNLIKFLTAINALFLQVDVQNRIVQQLRNSRKCVSNKDIKALMAELKVVYVATDEGATLSALDNFEKI